MGQYHLAVNLDKNECIHPHKLGNGLKLWEQLASNPGTGAALIILLASGSNGSGGGDLSTDHSIVGSWRGDRIAFVGDYDDETFYFVKGRKKKISGADLYSAATAAIYKDDPPSEKPKIKMKDVSDQVAEVLERELDGKYTGNGWREFHYNSGDKADHAMKPDMIITMPR